MGNDSTANGDNNTIAGFGFLLTDLILISMYYQKLSLMKVFALLALAVATGSVSMAQDSVWITPALPHRGAQVTIYFHSDKPVFAHAKKVAGGFYSLDDKNQLIAKDLAFEKSGDNWMATARVPDSMYAVAANVARPDSDAFAAVVAVGLDSVNGQLFAKSYLALAFAYSLPASILGVQDTKKAEMLRQQYWSGLSAPPSDFNGKLSYYTKTKKDTTKALTLIANLPLDSTAVENDYASAISVARQLKNIPLSTLLTNVRNQKYPLGNWKRFDYYSRLASATDTAAQWKILHEYSQAFPDDGQASGGMALLPRFKAMIRNKLAAAGDVSGALALIPASGLDRAGADNDIAWGAYQKNVDIARALAISKESLDTLQAFEASGKGKPAYETGAQYKKNLAYTYALYADTYAALLDKSGAYKEAFEYEKKALAGAGPKPDIDIVTRYHELMEKVETPTKVIASLSVYIAKGQSDSAMEAQFKRLYKGNKSPEEAYASLEAQAKATKQAEMVKTLMNERASGFTLVDLDGNKVSLDSLKGKTVIVDFWATWCGPCKASFPAMQKLVDLHKNDRNVAFLFVDTWETADDKKQNAADFIKKSPYTFHVLLDNDSKVVANYKVDGIPTKFVIDKDGMVRFKAVGFDGSTDGTVDEIESMIAVAQKN